ncbi:MAG: hypothetical protein IGS48_08135 [Oscillatoriales cyanobacterium C42_A2020_001]|nr:hypothetical protein [Leptolyngbyaceae cyanobacterium C42_A2020_001]
MQLKFGTTIISAIGLTFLVACNSGNQATSPATSAASTPAETKPSIAASPAASPATNAKTGETHTHGGQGGQVVESGPYHLELVTAKEATTTHIDFFLQKGDNHEPIPNAKVTAQVQLPDGSQKSLLMKYDAGDKHYTAILPSANSGEYKVAILTDINGEKVNARYSFKQ